MTVEQNHQWLIECFTSAREELMHRVARRDRLLTISILTQIVLWALANGIKFQAEASAPIPAVLVFSIPIGLVSAGLYFVEDNLVHQLSLYIRRLPDIQKQITSNTQVIGNWDSSANLDTYVKGLGLVIRAVTQAVVFVIVPLCLAGWYYDNYLSEPGQVAATIATLLVIAGGYFNRRSTT